MDKTHFFYIAYDPMGMTTLREDRNVTPRARHQLIEKIENEELEIYEIALHRNCPEHDVMAHDGLCCERAVELHVEGYIIAEAGLDGLYYEPDEIPNDVLSGWAEEIRRGYA